ncbi:MAG: DUF2619 domain-containing protein [Tepidanaerobacteraceae bacterium]|nr:DUF2619 domain-containing protein [Thermoanaerobacterales bacterium]
MDPILTSMAIMRVISSLIELTAAFLFLKGKSVQTALRINASLGLIGPLIFMGVSLLGITSLSGKVSFIRLVIILTGVLLVLIGTATK